MNPYLAFFVFLITCMNAASAPLGVGFRSITFVEGTELKVDNPEVASRIVRWLEEKGVKSIDYTKIGSVTPVFHVLIYGEGSTENLPIYLHCGEAARPAGVLSNDEATDLLLMFGLGQMWLLQEGLPRRTGEQIRQLDPGYRGK